MSEITSAKWMSALSDEKKLSEITIPGTHNSCAKNCNFIAKCQKENLTDQLNYGIRFLDIRCRHIEDRFDLYHGLTYLGVNFENMQKICNEFLNENPSETIIMQIKPEFKSAKNKCNFEEVFIKYANQFPGLWYMNERVPSLKEARGKVVLLRRFYSDCLPLGIDMSGWKNNKTFQMKNHHDFDFFIQDEYKKQSGDKWNQVVQHVNKASSDINNATWYLNYTSAHKLPMVPMVIAKDINKKLLNHFKNFENSNDKIYRLGTLIIDFADEDIIKQIYSFNFNGEEVLETIISPVK